jgi:hypothetical protein
VRLRRGWVREGRRGMTGVYHSDCGQAQVRL